MAKQSVEIGQKFLTAPDHVQAVVPAFFYLVADFSTQSLLQLPDAAGQVQAHLHLVGAGVTHPQVAHRLLVPQFDGQAVAMWDAARKKRLWSVEATREKNYPGLPMAFSEDGKLFAVEVPARVITVLDSVTGKAVCRLEGDVTNPQGY